MSVSEYQLLNKVLADKDFSLIEDNMLTQEHFPQVKDEFNYICSFYAQYKDIPDKETISAKFPEFKYFEVTQSVQSMVDDLREQALFTRTVDVINNSADLISQDANKGVEYLLSRIHELQPTYSVPYVDIMHDTSRFEEWKERQKNPKGSYIPLPFKELEDMLYGYQRGEELFLWLGKSGKRSMPSYMEVQRTYR